MEKVFGIEQSVSITAFSPSGKKLINQKESA